jgi:hypothetical protein
MDKGQPRTRQTVTGSEKVGFIQRCLSFALRHYLLLLFMFIQIPLVISFIVGFGPAGSSWLLTVLAIIIAESAVAIGLLFSRRYFGRYNIDGTGVLIDPTFPGIDIDTDKDQDE